MLGMTGVQSMEDVNSHNSEEKCYTEVQDCVSVHPEEENSQCWVDSSQVNEEITQGTVSETLELHDKSDGSDSGLGSDTAEDRIQRDLADSSEVEIAEIVTYGQTNENDCIVQETDPSNDVAKSSGKEPPEKCESEDGSEPCEQITVEPELDVPLEEENKMGLHLPLLIQPDAVDEVDSAKNEVKNVSENCDEESPGASVEKRSSLKRRINDDSEGPQCKKKKSILFDKVTVFYFPRSQGFTCVPSQGGSTLGMAAEHSEVQQFSLTEHAVEQRRAHRQLLLQLRNERLQNPLPTSSSEDSDSEEELSEPSDTELDIDNYYFLQPVPTRQRRALLRAAGVRKIDSYEKDECRDIRSSREFCGCACKIYCDPDTCSCSQAGIKCQVDRLHFPCGCTRDGCGNLTGRIEFNPVRVRTHFIHTLMRLELEKKQAEREQQDREQASSCSSQTWDKGNSAYCENKEGPQFQSKFNGGLLRDVTLSSGIEVESCVHSGNFTNMHYGENAATSVGNSSSQDSGVESFGIGDLRAREDSLDLYSFREDCYSENSDEVSTDHLDPPAHTHFSPVPRKPNQHQFGFSFSPSDRAFSGGGGGGLLTGFSNVNNSNNYIQQPHISSLHTLEIYDSTKYPHYSGFGFGTNCNQTPSFNAPQYNSNFTEFPKSEVVAESYKEHERADYNSPLQEPRAYEGFPECSSSSETKSEQPANECDTSKSCATNKYTNLHTVRPLSVHLEPLSELLQGRYAYLAAPSVGTDVLEEAEPCEVNAEVQNSTSDGSSTDGTAAEECDENFGEIIKKSMVETVSA